MMLYNHHIENIGIMTIYSNTYDIQYSSLYNSILNIICTLRNISESLLECSSMLTSSSNDQSRFTSQCVSCKEHYLSST